MSRIVPNLHTEIKINWYVFGTYPRVPNKYLYPISTWYGCVTIFGVPVLERLHQILIDSIYISFVPDLIKELGLLILRKCSLVNLISLSRFTLLIEIDFFFYISPSRSLTFPQRSKLLSRVLFLKGLTLMSNDTVVS